MNIKVSFDAVIEAWNEPSLRCEMPTAAGHRCQRPAYWRVDLHGCEVVLMCGHHKRSWLADERGRQHGREHPRCDHCKREFPTFDDAVTVTPL